MRLCRTERGGAQDEDPDHRLVGPDRHESRAAAAARRPSGLRDRQAAQHVDRRVPVPAPGPRRPLRAVSRRHQRRGVPGGRPRRASRGAREGAPARPRAASGARERDDDVQRPRVRAAGEHPDRLLLEPRGLRRRAPVRGVQRAGRRLRLHGEHVLRVEDRGRGVHLLVRALLRPAVPRVPVLERVRQVRQRPRADGPRDSPLHPLDAPRRADHDLRRPRQDPGLHVRRRLRGRDHPGHRGARRADGSSTRRSTSPTARATRSSTARSGSPPSSGPSRA